jgi:hypothetical protein
MARKRLKMVGWFDPGQLVATAIRVVISTLFGEFADKREAFAASNPISDAKIDPCFDYRSRYPTGDFWLDYVADTGDGWNPTFAVARLLAEDSFTWRRSHYENATTEELCRGRVLIMGGDEVYPTPSKEGYEDRLKYPFEEACKRNGVAAWSKEERPDVYAMPGNHDWYDGLRNFFHIFCRRTIKAPGQASVDRDGSDFAGWQTHQTRSYFALRLPHGWWLWGTDSQLKGYIDQPQVDFFKFVAEQWMEPGSKLILCAGTPDWEYVRKDCPEKFSNLSYLERLAPAVEGKNHQLKLLLSGDSHHYARFHEGELNYITCGGGGAFLHGTQHLPKTAKPFDFAYPPPGVRYEQNKAPYRRCFSIAKKQGTDKEALYPSRRTSEWLLVGNLLFAFKNWKLTLTLAGIYLFFTWLLDFNARISNHGSLIATLAAGNLDDSMNSYWRLVGFSPSSVLLCVAATAAYYYFVTDVRKWPLRLLIGAVLALVQARLVTLATCVVVRLLAPQLTGAFLQSFVCLGAAATVSAIASATLIGLYLSVALSWFKIHWGHFSSLAVEGYKSFLRLRIDGDGALHVYPIGLKKVPSTRGWTWKREKPARRPRLAPHLIEEPIVIS